MAFGVVRTYGLKWNKGESYRQTTTTLFHNELCFQVLCSGN